jgi:hypothetical protein
MKAYGGLEVQLHSFVVLTPDGANWSASHPGHCLRKSALPLQGRTGHASLGLDVTF